MIWGMEKEYYFVKTALNTKDISIKDQHMAGADWFILMEKFTKENGIWIKHKGLVHIFIKMGQPMKEIGKKIFSRVKE